MELRDQDKEMGMPLPSSFSYNNKLNRDSSTKVYPSSSSSSQPINSSVHGDSQVLNPRPTQTLNHYPLYRDLDPEIDPGSASAGGARANRSSGSPLPPPPTSPPQPVSSADPLIRYRECLKNHAASRGTHVVDGCGEFMPSGEQGTMGALKCAACECHRNFHRKEINGKSKYAPASPSRYHTGKNSVVHLQQPTPLNQQRFSLGLSISSSSSPVPIAPVMMNFGRDGGYGGGPTESLSEDLNMFHQGGQSSHDIIQQSSKKRFRTKFSQDQKVKMMEFAEKLDWRIQKQDEQELQHFCAQVGVKRQVFKVWMHNNIQAMKKKQM
ncbi:zinc-finger homeodomain protein 6-like isoform X2 [Hibiscus syriacus]|uniref:zinc-finger homeodomain protein 6-like isoform X2 n=1 Tax=Hibiscus syriacus TaxID=106335 RepID=UPI001921B046|nr:zinc-finger homeodomain protein 6-like isoform X2 [Hibiscus syriacus]